MPKIIWIDNTVPPTNYIWMKTDLNDKLIGIYEYIKDKWQEIDLDSLLCQQFYSKQEIDILLKFVEQEILRKIAFGEYDITQVVVDSELDPESRNPVSNNILTAILNSKQDKIRNLEEIKIGALYGKQAYIKPRTGIRKTDLEESIQRALTQVEENTAILETLDTDYYTRDQVTNLISGFIDNTVDNLINYYTKSEIDSKLANKQDTLVSGENIKTINNISIVGPGNLTLSGGGIISVDAALSNTSKNPVQNKVVKAAIDAKQDTISDLNNIRNKANSAYQKPVTGIPDTDLSQSVKNSLNKADTALQSYTETDPTVPSWAKASNKPSYNLSEISEDSTHRTVTDNEKSIWNSKYSKPSSGIPSTDLASGVIPTNVSTFNNDAGYLTSHQDVSGKEDKSNKVTSFSSTTTDTNYPSEKLVKDSLDLKQDLLVSGTNIKTINNQTILGTGNISISGGGSGGDVNVIEVVKVNGSALTPDSNKAVDITVPDVSGFYTKPSGGIPASDIASGVIPSDVVQYASQSLTDAQKMQARKNQGLYYEETTTEQKTVEYEGPELDELRPPEVKLSDDTPAIEDIVDVLYNGLSQEHTCHEYTGYYTVAVSGGAIVPFYVILEDNAYYGSLQKGVYIDSNLLYSGLQLVYNTHTTTISQIPQKFLPAYPTVPVTDVTVGGTSVVSNGTAVVPAIPTVPTISTDISADAASNTKTASPKAVKTYADTKYTKPSGGIPATDLASGVIPSVPTNVSAFTNDAGYITAHQDITGKADKVTSATSGNFAALDSNGNLTDSGHKHSDYLTSHQDITGKADKVSSPTAGNFAGLDSNGNLTDSGSKASDFLTSHQDISGKQDKTAIVTTGGVTQELANNTEYRYTSATASLTISAPASVPSDYISWLVFVSGSTATSLSYPAAWKWSGDDVSNGAFVPDADKIYNVCVWYDGVNINAISRGVWTT